MSHPLDDHPYFTRWTDPQTEAESYVLSERIAPIMKAHYFETPSMKGDSKWLWFGALCPPGNAWQVGVVSLDPDDPQIRLIPGAHYTGNPWVDPDGETICVPIDEGIFRFDVEGNWTELFRMPNDVRKNRYLYKLVTDLTVTADGRYFLLDSHVGNRWLLSLVDCQTGELTELEWFHNAHIHCFASPVDPTLFAVAQNHWIDPTTGEKNNMHVRLWFMDTQGTRYEPVFGDLWFGHNCMSCHEWFGPDGTFYWCDYREGIYHCGTGPDRTRELLWNRPSWHGQTDPSTGRYHVADIRPYTWNPCQVYFYDAQLQRDLAIASDLPSPLVQGPNWRKWHLDPHPHFSQDGQYVIHTTTAPRGEISVAVVPTEPLKERVQTAGEDRSQRS
jgi:hypothetical protein